MKNQTQKRGEKPDAPRVLIVAPVAPPVGGQAVQAAHLLNRFKTENSVEIDLQPTNPRFLPALQKIKYARTVATSIRYIFDLFSKIPRFDVIHIFSAGETGFLISTVPALFVAKLFGKKTILNYHHGGAAAHLNGWRAALPIIKRFDRIVVPSGFLVEVFAKFGLPAQAIFNVVDAQKFCFRPREPLRPVFLSNRNFDAHYNIGCVLKAFALVQKRIPDAELLVAGDGAEREKLKKLAAELNLKNTAFLGIVAPDAMPKLYDRADIYLNSSNVDNMPLSIVEAFAAGLPVVTTDAGGIPYILRHGETGLMVKTNDCDALARAAITLLENQDAAQKIIAKARSEVLKYSWEAVRTKWLALYAELQKNF